MLLIRACERSPIATRSAAYTGADRGRYQRIASAYIGSATMPASPSRQSIPSIVTMLSTTSRTAVTRLGTTSVTALPITATSSPTRDSRSPLPTRSTVWIGSRSARSTVRSRRSARIPSPRLRIRNDANPAHTPPITAADAITETTHPMVDGGAPSCTRSTRTPKT